MSNEHRAGDRDRQKTAVRLGQALAQGYLQMDEYEQRVQATFQTQKAGELDQLLADLPLDKIRRADPRRRAAQVAAARKGLRIHVRAFITMAVIVLTVWAAVAVTAGAWYFWPIWPILGGAIGLTSHTMSIPKSREQA
jgi:Flp pilus assembly protein TadB